MQNIMWIIQQMENPFFWIIPVLSFILLAVWPAIINVLEDKASRINTHRR
jgi:hypothetical protein